ncbi:MAG: hypothetical protein AAF799_30270 [Myxococcota bacterium]
MATFASHMARGVPLTVGYFGPYAIQPGVRVGTWFPIKAWTKTRDARRGPVTRTGSLFAGPQLAFFARPGNHLSVMASGELGYRFQRHDRKVHSAFAIGGGYLASFQIVTIAVDLSSGDKNNTREMRHYFVPTLSYALGHDVLPNFGWFLKFSYGQKLSVPIESSAMVMVELGLSFRLGGRRP